MNKKQKKMLIRIMITAVMLAALFVIPVTGILQFALYLLAYLIIGYDILKKAGKGIVNRQVFDENFLMAVATIGAFALAVYKQSGDYVEAIAVMLFYQIGELFQSYAVGKSRRNISALMDIRPDYANVERDGKLMRTDPDEVETGSVIVVQPGEKVPIDGIVTEGVSSLNTSALTGESLPRDVRAGDEIISGCINMTGVMRIRTTKEFGESTVSKILELVENASSRKFYRQICPRLYAGGLLWRACTCASAACGESGGFGRRCPVGCMDIQGVDLPCDKLPLCAGHQYPVKLLCGDRWGQQGGRADQRLQLYGNLISGSVHGI